MPTVRFLSGSSSTRSPRIDLDSPFPSAARLFALRMFGFLFGAFTAATMTGCAGLPIPKLYNDAPGVTGAVFRDGAPVGGVDVRLVRRWDDIEHVEEQVTDGNGKFSFGIIEHLELMREIPFLDFTRSRYEWEICFDHGSYCCAGSKKDVGDAPDKISAVCELGDLVAGTPRQSLFCQGELTKNSDQLSTPFQQCSFREPQLVEMQLRGGTDDLLPAAAPQLPVRGSARRLQQGR